MKSYRIMLDDEVHGRCSGIGHITEEGAQFIYAAYIKQWGNGQSMDTREKRGGICWLSEIEYWIKCGLLPKGFDWRKFEVTLKDK